MTLRAWLASVVALLAGLLSLLSVNLTHALGTRPPTFIYNCLDIGFGTCTFRSTPPFDSCGGFATWYCATHPPPPPPPDPPPCSFTEIPFSGPFGERGKQCSGSARSIALPDCGDGWHPTIPNSVDTLCVPNADFKRKEAQLGKPPCCVGDPINPAPSVGNNFVLEVDYVGTGPFPLRLEHYYNSAGTKISPGMFGLAFAMANWRHSYERSISFSVAQGLSFARVFRKDGKWIFFMLVGSNWTPEEPDIVERLEQVVENSQTIWKFTNFDDEIERYDVLGRLLSITNRAGLTQTVVNDALNRVTSVSDPFGKTLTFNYGAPNCDPVRCVASVQDPNGNLIQFGYTTVSLFGNAVIRLKTVTYPGTATPRTYNYEDTNDALALIELIDENGASTTWSYPQARSGRVGSSQLAGGADKVTLEYLSDTSTRVTATISGGATPVTRVNTYQFQRIQGIDYVTSITGDACPSCGPKTMQYDANGFRSRITDWNSNVTTYLREDATRLDLETQRVEAFGTPQARTITTTWHPMFRLPTLVTEPGRTTAMTYDATGKVAP